MNADIREHMEVVGSDGGHVGTVDRLERGRILVAKGDAVGGRHRSIPAEWVERIDDKVRLDRPSSRALSDIDLADPAPGEGVVGSAGAVLFPDEPPHER